ncbi:MAG: response regulator [Parcubacteria group bacterium]|nr:response regulator [Parcubacteria group bacterium]
MTQEIPKPTVLIIDDDNFLLDMYALKFSQNGFSVVAEMSAGSALERLRDGLSPEVILTDVLMPGMDGFTFLEHIQDEHLADQAKIIVLSNKGEKQDIDQGVSLGADGYIIKASMIPSEVVDKVRSILNK